MRTKKEVVSELLKCLCCTDCYYTGVWNPLASVPRDTIRKTLVILSHDCVVSKPYLDRLIMNVNDRVADGSDPTIMHQQLLNDIVYWLEQERNRDDEPFSFPPDTKVAIELAYNLRVDYHDQIPIVVYRLIGDESQRCIFADYQTTKLIIDAIPKVFEIILDDRIYQFEFTGDTKHEYIYKECKKRSKKEELTDEDYQ